MVKLKNTHIALKSEALDYLLGRGYTHDSSAAKNP